MFMSVSVCNESVTCEALCDYFCESNFVCVCMNET